METKSSLFIRTWESYQQKESPVLFTAFSKKILQAQMKVQMPAQKYLIVQQ